MPERRIAGARAFNVNGQLQSGGLRVNLNGGPEPEGQRALGEKMDLGQQSPECVSQRTGAGRVCAKAHGQ